MPGQKLHHQIRLRIQSCGRMREMRREPEVPEAEVPAVECLDGLARITSEELAITHFVKNGPPEYLFYKTKSGCRCGEKCSFAHRQVDEQPTKRSKTNDDKSAVAILKKRNWQERESVTDECHDRPGKPGKRGYKKLGQNSSKRQFSVARQLGLRISGHEAAEVYSPEGHRHAETSPTCEIHKDYCTSYKNSRPKSLARIHLSR